MVGWKIRDWLLCFFIILSFRGYAFSYTADGFDFQYRKDITIDYTKIDANLSYFPVLIKLNSSNIDFSHFLQADGSDIRFSAAIDGGGNATGDLLDYERERFEKGNEVAEIWVEIPLVNSGSDTTFYMFYGNNSCPDGEDIEHTWDGGTDASPLNNYIGVWHLDETGATVYDSTSNSYDGSVTGASPNSSSYIAGGYDFVREPDTDYIEMLGTANGLQLIDFTAEAWTKTPDSNIPDDYYTVTQSLYCDGIESWALNIADDTGYEDKARFTTVESDTQTRVFGSVVTGNQWHYLAGVRTATQLLIYVDDSPANSVDDDRPGQVIQSSANIAIGSAVCATTDDFNGTIDEVRISNIARPPEWVKASYHSGNNSLLTIPTLVELSYFRAKGLNSAVLLEWATETELDNAGFNVWRSEEKDGEYVRINPYFIPAQGEAGLGAEYSYTDYDVRNGKIYYYKLEDIDIYGKSTFHGPVSSIPNDIIPIWPDEGKILPSGALLFSWASSGSFYFKVEISMDPSFPVSEWFAFPGEEWTNGHSLWLTPREWEMVLSKAQQSGGQLFWRVRAKNKDGREIFSDWKRFVIEKPSLLEE